MPRRASLATTTSEDSGSSAVTKPKFSNNEKVLCYDGPLIYNARVLMSRPATELGAPEGSFEYLVHYSGWSKTHDQWVTEAMVLKVRPKAMKEKERLKKIHVDEKGKTNNQTGPEEKRKTKERSLTMSPKQQQQSEDKEEEEGTSSYTTLRVDPKSSEEKEEKDDNDPMKFKFKIRLPEELKFVLVSDQDLVVHKGFLFKLPAETSASAIIDDFVGRQEENVVRHHLVKEVMLGVKEFFNEVVGKTLIYKSERDQYRDLVGSDVDGNGNKGREDKLAVDLYGSAHLLRLMVTIDGLLNQTSLVGLQGDVKLIEGVIVEFLTYLESNSRSLFTSKNYTKD